MKGIDVSDFQKEIDFAAVKESGLVEFVYAQATDGLGSPDYTYPRNAQVCRERGIPFGAYHFFRFNHSPEQQAEHFLNNAKIIKGDLLPMVDVEGDSMPSVYELANAIDLLSRFNKIVEDRIGARLVLYTGWSFWNTQMRGTDAFSGHALWIAETADPSLPGNLPNGFTTWKIWQYGTGPIPGIADPVDLDISNGELDRV